MAETILLFNNHEHYWIPPVEGEYEIRVEYVTLSDKHDSTLHICCDVCKRLTYYDSKCIPALYSILPGVTTLNNLCESVVIFATFNGVRFYIQSDTELNVNINIRIILVKL